MPTTKKIHSDNPWDLLTAAYQAENSVLSGIAASPWYWVDTFKKAIHNGDEQEAVIALQVMKAGGTLSPAAFTAIKNQLRTYDQPE